MSVAPDLLLRPAPEIKPKAAANKAPEKPVEPSRNKDSDFAQVYARERQSQVAERSGKPAGAARDERESTTNEASESAEDASALPVVADTGNGLPETPLAEAGGLDPLLLLGMTGELTPAAEVEEGAEVALLEGALEQDVMPEVELAPTSLISSGPASMTEASFDPEVDALNQLPGVRLALALGAHDKQPAEQASPVAHAVKAAQSAGEGFAASFAGKGDLQVETGEAEFAELQLSKLNVQALEVAKESSADTAPENFVSKLSSLSQAIAQQNAQVRSAPPLGQPVAMNQGGWSEAVVDRVMLMSSQNLKSAEIQLDPAELGRLEVRISVNQEQTQVTFASPNANVRDALESQMHRLREMLGQQGMNLLDANVSDQSLSRGWQGQGDGSGGGRRGAEEAGLADSELVGAVTEMAQASVSNVRGLVDYYA